MTLRILNLGDCEDSLAKAGYHTRCTECSGKDHRSGSHSRIQTHFEVIVLRSDTQTTNYMNSDIIELNRKINLKTGKQFLLNSDWILSNVVRQNP